MIKIYVYTDKSYDVEKQNKHKVLFTVLSIPRETIKQFINIRETISIKQGFDTIEAGTTVIGGVIKLL